MLVGEDYEDAGMGQQSAEQRSQRACQSDLFVAVGDLDELSAWQA